MDKIFEWWEHFKDGCKKLFHNTKEKLKSFFHKEK